MDAPTPPASTHRWIQAKCLDRAGRRPSGDPVHRAIAALSSGDRLRVETRGSRWQLLDGAGTVVGTLAGAFEPPTGAQVCCGALRARGRLGLALSIRQRPERGSSDTSSSVAPMAVILSASVKRRAAA